MMILRRERLVYGVYDFVTARFTPIDTRPRNSLAGTIELVELLVIPFVKEIDVLVERHEPESSKAQIWETGQPAAQGTLRKISGSLALLLFGAQQDIESLLRVRNDQPFLFRSPLALRGSFRPGFFGHDVL